MFQKGYKIRDQQAIHFITFAVVEWVDVFIRKEYRDIIIESLKYCQDKKGLNIYSWCLMSNHLHLIVSVKEGLSLSSVLRDFKKYTSNQIVQAIEQNFRARKKPSLSVVLALALGWRTRIYCFIPKV